MFLMLNVGPDGKLAGDMQGYHQAKIISGNWDVVEKYVQKQVKPKAYLR